MTHVPEFELLTSQVVTLDSGMRRDNSEGKTRYSLVYDGPMIDRWAEHLTKGVSARGLRNWMKANSEADLDSFTEAAGRHFRKWLRGDVDEDHAAALFFNVNGVEYVKPQLAS